MQFSLNPDTLYQGEHEQLPSSKTIALEFTHALRSAGFVREYAHCDTYDGYSAFADGSSEALVVRVSMMDHPTYRGREYLLTMTDAQRLEKDATNG